LNILDNADSKTNQINFFIIINPDLLILNAMIKERGILINDTMTTTVKRTKENHSLIISLNFSL
jgi:hypothetical protein